MNIKNTNIFNINEELCGQRLDNFLIKKLKGIPKSLIYKLVRSGQVRVNKKRIKVSYRIKLNDIVRIPPNIHKDQFISKNVISDSASYIEYENDNFLLINKPSGIAVHGGTNQKTDFLSSLKLSLENDNLTLVHRLDKNTSGCLLVAKNYHAASYLGKIFGQREIKKKYYALLSGHLKKDIIEIESKIKKDSNLKKMVISADNGKDAYSKITLIKKFRYYSLVEIEIETGRTHQIRAHVASIGHPIAGDKKYTTQEYNVMNKLIGLNRTFLHSFYLSFYFNEQYNFTIDLPDDLKEVLSRLESYV